MPSPSPQRKPDDPTPEEIWGPVPPTPDNPLGLGLAELERRNRPDRSETPVSQAKLIMMPYGKLLGSE